MKTTKIALMAVLVSLFLASQAWAWGPGFGRGRGGCGPCWEPGVDRLNLTDEQKAKIDTLQTTYGKATEPLREKMFDKSVELRRLWLKTQPDKDKIAAAQKELRELRDQMEDKVTALRLEIRNVLTPEQNEKLANTGWGPRPGFRPRGGMRGYDGYGPGPGLGMGICPP